MSNPKKVPTLRKSFSDIRKRRNDVMHAHNIDKEEFSYSRRLFETVNREIDTAIEGLADGVFAPDSYNQDIETAMQDRLEEAIEDTNLSDLQKSLLKGIAARQKVKNMELMLQEDSPEKYSEYLAKTKELNEIIEETTNQINKLQELNKAEQSRKNEIEILKLEMERGHAAETLVDKISLLESYLGDNDK